MYRPHHPRLPSKSPRSSTSNARSFPINDQLRTSTGGYQPYLAANKLRGKRALITGGDSGIGRAVAILYAMEGAVSTIVYMPQEEEDAQETKKLVEEKGGKLFLLQADLREQRECKRVVEETVSEKALGGGIDILVLNHGTQLTKDTIGDLSEYSSPPISSIPNFFTQDDFDKVRNENGN